LDTVINDVLVAIIARVTGSTLPPGALIAGARRLVGVTAGSRAMPEQLVSFVE
jgi:hypothetical protein